MSGNINQKKEDKLDKIKSFFNKKKQEAKFKLNMVGTGSKLGADASVASSNPRDIKPVIDKPKPRPGPSTTASEPSKFINPSVAVDATSITYQDPVSVESQKTLFRCPLICSDTLTKEEWITKIRDFVTATYNDQPHLMACLLLRNCNSPEKQEICVDILQKYLKNLMNNPNEEKYRKIRQENQIYIQRVKDVEGALEFLKSVGFQELTIDNEPFLIYEGDVEEEKDKLQQLLDELIDSKPIPLELDRGTRLIKSQMEVECLPSDFFELSSKEIQSEQKTRAKILEESQTLMIKSSVAKGTTPKNPDYTMIRIRFPDGTVLQGTFDVQEELLDVYNFVKASIQYEKSNFFLTNPKGQKFTDEQLNRNLLQLGLVPNAVLLFDFKNVS